MNGRKPKPTELKKLLGVRSSRINERSAHQIEGRPEATARIKADPIAAAKWVDLVGILEKTGVLSKADTDGIEHYCLDYSLNCLAWEKIKTGSCVETVNGREYSSKWYQVFMDTGRRLKDYQELFGLTPSSRGRVHANAPEDTAKTKWQNVI